MNRKCGQSDRRTFADKDKVPRYQTLGNDDKDAMLDFQQSEDKRNCYIYVTSIVIIKLTFVMVLLKHITLSAVIFPFFSLTTGHYETEGYRCQPIFSEGLNLIIQFAGFFFFFFFFLSSHSGDQVRRSFFQNIGVVGSTTLAG